MTGSGDPLVEQKRGNFVISVNSLSRSFDGLVAVEAISFEIPEGKLFTLLGPNGAGKTTTVRMLMGLIAPSSGNARVAGFDLAGDAGSKSRLRGACGLLTETPGFYDRMSAWENLQFFGRLYDIAESKINARLEHYLRFMELWDRRDEPVATFSKGMKQKLAIIRSVFHEPKVIFMDEPTAGLDPEASLSVREMILKLKHEGRTIVVCSHNLDEAERLADIVGILKRRLIVCDTLQKLRAVAGGAVLVEIEIIEPKLDVLEFISSLPFVHSAHQVESRFNVEVVNAAVNVPALVRELAARGANIMQVTPRVHSLEEVYLSAIRAADSNHGRSDQ